MVVHCDIPLLTAGDIDELMAVYRRADVDVLLSPDRNRGGTNIMVFDCEASPGFHYGPGSCQAHREAAKSLGLRFVLAERENVALDIDEPADLIELCRRLEGMERPGRTAQLLSNASIRQRIALIAGGNPDLGRSTGS
jgi:2-phospho-L-lactate guanylyltransferase (CobY/MobA/RfbA family)